jgi:hypothetical protein
MIDFIKDTLLSRTARIQSNLTLNQKFLAEIAKLIDKENILKNIENPINYFEEEEEEEK